MDAVALTWSRLAPLAAAHGLHGESWLSASERSKLERMRAPARRAQFLAGRWLLRELLARCHGGVPQDWQLTAPEQGPPTVEAPAINTALHLALSHSADLIACAVADMPVGVDLELPKRQRDLAALAAMCCDAREQAQLQRVDAAQREALFYAFWTAKEAWLKRHGEDLAPRRLAQIHLRPAAADTAASLRVWHHEGWTLALAAAPGTQVRWHAPAPALGSQWDVVDDVRPA